MMKRRLIALVLALGLLLAMAVPTLAIPDTGAQRLALLQEIRDLLLEYHLYATEEGPVINVTAAELEADEGLLDRVVEGWLADDAYGYFMTAEEYDDAFVSTQVFGIGVSVNTTMAKGTYVTNVLPNSPAAGSGMKHGAQILAVDGVDVTDASFMEVTRPLVIAGDNMSPVAITYINPGSVTPVTETLYRGTVNVPNINAYILDEDTGCVSITSFASSYDVLDFYAYYYEVLPAMGITKCVIDLRDNPGGSADSVAALLDFLFADDANRLLFTFCYADATQFERVRSTGYYKDFADVRYESLTVMINENSYSASEVMAGVLSVYGKATLVGQTTGGKSCSQYHWPLSSGDKLIFTVSDIMLFGRGSYQNVGIVPDVTVENTFAFGAELGFPALSEGQLMLSGAVGERVRALELRLAALGYFYDTPDERFDAYTLWCVNRFQVTEDLAQTRYVPRSTLTRLNERFDSTAFYIDLQTAYVLDMP